ncbi:uncharacterized protein B0T15DRAFT_532214 [Chaetomium strumarium]|uniref:Amidohydrolase-related domain-containing protein n=1 Tax=Chaetomium strumarium TaxID=1170767 RepID=A0AAJ0M1H2_9PEZI|nr:hypothetical protein B0T15DRAFT_532214 [Chaetomium strumarium]
MTPRPLITLEEHSFSSAVPDTLRESYSEQLKHVDNVLAKSTDLGELRRHDMDAGSVTLQVISHAPGLGEHDATACRAANDQLAAAIKAEQTRSSRQGQAQGTGRFTGFAVAPMHDPDEAAAKLRRAVRELGFVGALVDNHCGGTFYDGARYDVWWAAAEELDVPVYLYPTWPSGDMLPRYESNSSRAAAESMASSGMGWHTETGLHVLRLFASGLFDRHRGSRSSSDTWGRRFRLCCRGSRR